MRSLTEKELQRLIDLMTAIHFPIAKGSTTPTRTCSPRQIASLNQTGSETKKNSAFQLETASETALRNSTVRKTAWSTHSEIAMR